MIIIKTRSLDTENWPAYAEPLGNTHSIYLNSSSGKNSSNASWWDNTTPDESKFRVGDSNHVNKNTETYSAYLFASCPGVSSVGTFTVVNGGSNIDVNCGFTAGARFVLIKRTDGSGNWMIFDTTRGINADGVDDPYLKVNSNIRQVTDDDYINPLTSGFQANSDLPSGDFIYLAIA